MSSIFRKEAVDRLRSPDEVDQLLRVVNRRSWIPLAIAGAAPRNRLLRPRPAPFPLDRRLFQNKKRHRCKNARPASALESRPLARLFGEVEALR